MKILKRIQLLALLPILLAIGCNKGDEPSIVVPTVLSSTPAAADVDVATNASIEIVFDKTMKTSTINATTFTLAEGANNIEGDVTYSNETATFNPTIDLDPSTTYTAKLTTGVESNSGVPIAEEYTFSFLTGLTPDDAPPTVVSISPQIDASGVARNKVITITFNEDMKASSFTSSTFIVKKGSNTITGSIQYVEKTARFIPAVALDADGTYSVTVTTGVMDISGNELVTPKEWAFVTGSEAAGLAAVNLGSSINYVILAKTAISTVPTSAITGHIGLSPAATSFVTGFGLTNAIGYATSPQITGKIYAADMVTPTSDNLTAAVLDMQAAYTDAAGRLLPDHLNLLGGAIGGETLAPGLYNWGTSVGMSDDVTLSGSADAVWIFQVNGNLTMAAAKNIILAGGAQAKNIFWQVTGQATLGANTHFEGIILSATGITLQTGASLNGRLLAQTAVALDGNAVTKPN